MSTVKRSARRTELVASLIHAFRENSAATIFFHAAVAERLGLNPTDHKCVDLIHRHGPMTAGELGRYTGLTSGAITGVVDRLERGGFVHRTLDPTDRRRVIIQPTHNDAFAGKMCEIFGPIARASEALAEEYSDEELTAFIEFVGRCSELALSHARRLRTELRDELRTGSRAERKRAADLE